MLGSLERKHSSRKSTSSEETHEEIIKQKDGIYSHADETFYELANAADGNSSSEYQELDVNYESVQGTYEKLLPEPNAKDKKVWHAMHQNLFISTHLPP